MLVKPSTPPPEPLQPSRSTVLNTSQPVPPSPKPLVDLPQTSTTYNVPHVRLDTDHISNAMAARLATSLLGHVLFLKSQIPFPVVQMSRMGTMQSKSTSKAAKKRIELMAAIDTLSSHLETTFLALSSAFAQRQISGLGAGVAAGKSDQPVTTKENEKEKAHMIFVVGPSVGAAKAKVALVFDGLEVKLRDDTAQVWESPPPPSSDTEGSASDSSEEEEDESTASEGSALDDSSEAEGERDTEQEEAPPPPASPSPSPSPAPSRPTTPLSLPRTTKPSPSPSRFTIYSDPPLPLSYSSSLPDPHPFLAFKPLSASKHTPTSNQNPKPSPLKPLHGPLKPLPLSPHSQSSHSQTHKSLQTAHAAHHTSLQTADRLLSRTLATFCAEDERGGMSCELAPTQTHVLLRAPRRFVHPAWVPRLNLCRSLEGALEAFVEGSTAAPATTTVSKQKVRVGVKVEGVWVSCRDRASSSSSLEEEGGRLLEKEGRPSRERKDEKEEEANGVEGKEQENKEEDRKETEKEEEKLGDKEKEEKEKAEDEMIWWQWDGKIVGFSDW